MIPIARTRTEHVQVFAELWQEGRPIATSMASSELRQVGSGGHSSYSCLLRFQIKAVWLLIISFFYIKTYV